MVDIRGRSLDTATADFLREHQVRAVCLFRHNLGTEDEVKRLTADLREVMGEGALIAIDQEGGSVVRATFLPQAPAAMALGAAGDATLAEQVGEAVGRGVRSLGFNWDFAPVLDVNNNPANPVIAERSFSEDPAEVARLARAWMRGALRAGVACCVKHFPGHGDTHMDSHSHLPVVDKSGADIEALELQPFFALKDEAPAMMTAHIVYPQLDPEHPATLSKKILGGLLRQAWGYDGVVITDSLVMKAIYDHYGHDRAAVLALDAGADMVMALGSREDQATAIASIARAQADGRLDAAVLSKAQARLDALAARFPAGAVPYDAVQRGVDDVLMHRAWAAGLSALGEPARPAPGARVRVITQSAVPCDGVSEAGLPAERVARLFDGGPAVEFVEVEDLQSLDAGRLKEAGVYTVLVSNHRDRYRNAAGWQPELHLALWNPFQALDVKAPTLITWGYADGALDAVRTWWQGDGHTPGRPPVTLS
jgi:beta-N-acetylhexosaminidase